MILRNQLARFLCLLIFVTAIQVMGQERILSFDSNITVQQDASLMVRETIRVQSTGDQIKHGIFRDFPTRYHDRLGNAFTVDFGLKSASRDQQPETYRIEDLRDGVRIRLGNPGLEVPAGEHTYEITYRVTRELGFFANNDELYWNVTGNGWAFPIDTASATVTLPAPGGKLTYTGYTGARGSRGQAFEAAGESDTTVRFNTTAPLATG